MIARRDWRLLAFLILLFSASGCVVALNQANVKFTSASVMTLKSGMTLSEVQQMFGTPTRTKSTSCGQATARTWSCRILYYDVEFDTELNMVTKTNTFFFDEQYDPPRLISWDIERMW